MTSRLALAVAMLVCIPCSPLAAQQTTTAAPFHSTGHGYFEHIGIGWGFRTGNFFFQQNGFGAATPPFGGFTPGTGANFGWGWQGGGASGFFNVTAGQGSRSGLGVVAPSVTLSNGVPGGMFAGSVTPFVLGTIPVVNGPPATISPLQERIQRLREQGAATPPLQAAHANVDQPAGDAFSARLSAANAGTAAHAGMSLAQIEAARAARQAAADAETQELLERARRAEAAGKPAVAKIYYQQAARRASGK